MRRLLLLTLVALAMLALVLPATAVAHTAAAPYTSDLVQGRKLTDVGDVKVWNDASFLYVKFEAASGFGLFGTKVDVKTDWHNIPQAKGNAIPGRFTYKALQDHATSYTQKIPITWPVGTKVYIAAHAEAGKLNGSVADVCATLPSLVTEQVAWPSGQWSTWSSYWDITLSGGTTLDGDYNGWCGDPAIGLQSGWTGPAIPYCSYSSSIPAGLVEKPENLDSVNWVLNQDYVGQGTRWPVVQAAIWKLLSSKADTYIPDLSLWPGEAAVVDAIVADALSHDGFLPGCDQFVVIVLAEQDAATGEPLQPNLIVKRIPCYGTGIGTAWAKGAGFPGKDWSMYFSYVIQ